MTVILLHAFPLDERMWEPQLVSADELRDYDVRVIHGAGHLPSLEAADTFNAELEEFLAGE